MLPDSGVANTGFFGPARSFSPLTHLLDETGATRAAPLDTLAAGRRVGASPPKATQGGSMAAEAIEATRATFDDEVLASEKPVIVDFWADWCTPCHFVAPVLDEIARERADELRLVKVNVDEEPALAQRYGIMNIPTIVLFKAGAPAAAAIGAQPKSALERALGLAEA
jgi:thioredoxin 1